MRSWIGLTVAVLVSIFAALATLGGLLQAVGADHSHDASRTSGVVLAVVFGLVLVVCVRWATHVEHRIRARTVGSPASVPAASVIRFAVGRRRRPYSPISLIIQCVFVVAAFIGCVVGAVAVHGEWLRSQYVQQHGVADTGTVQRVHNIKHTSRSSTWYTADVAVHLDRPVNGVDVTVAHFPHGTDLATGDRVQILVDPRSPGYAEFSKYPATKAGGWVLLIVFAVALAGIGVFVGYEVVHLRRRRRSYGVNMHAPSTAPW